MTINLTKAIEASKKIMAKPEKMSWKNPIFSSHAPGYFTTSEKIDAYLKNMDLAGKKALSVLSSGDHNFNLILKGIRAIDTFDINEIPYFIYYLKYALIRSSSLEEFTRLKQEILTREDLTIWKSILPRLKEFSPADAYLYFQEMVSFHQYLNRKYKEENRFNKLFLVPDNGSYSNLYDANKKDYQTLKENLEKTEVQFYFEDARALPKNNLNRYHLIILSNIADYLFNLKTPEGVAHFKEYINQYVSLLDNDGALINYFFGVYGGTSINKDDLSLSGLSTILEKIPNEQAQTEHAYYLVRKK